MRTLLLAVICLAACGGAAPAAVASTAPGAVSPSPSPSPTPPPNALVLRVSTEGSKATVRVNEVLAINNGAASDAVLVGTNILEGSLALLPDGSFWQGAVITISLRRLASDVPLRDKWLELFGPQFGRFPTATFIPAKVEGLPLPLPASGEWSFTTIGQLKIRDVTKTVRLASTLKREGASISATAKTTFTWEEFSIPRPLNIPQVASVTDDIRIEVSFAAVAGS
jgi:polyisoprenoid-binding protein YceI